MHPHTEKDLTYTLLIELLAHQFAFPVRWIETQDFILGETQAERLVEVGPSNVLMNMMKRTWSEKFALADLSQGIQRQFLGPADSQAEIYYRAGPLDQSRSPGATEANNSKPVTQRSEPKLPDPLSISASQPPEASPQSAEGFLEGPVEQLSDIGVSPSAIVSCIVATKLKKTPSDIPLEKTINDVTGGRSTLANEIVGDLVAEFSGRLPDRPEEIGLGELCEMLKTNHEGQLGKSTISLVSRMISSKFPGDYGNSRVRQTLQDSWGLGPGRQDTALLLAIAKQPASRMSASSDAERFLADVASEYYRQEGLSSPSRPGVGRASGGGAAVVDAKSLQMVNENNASLLRGILEMLTGHLGESRASEKGGNSAETTAGIAEQLDRWLDEHGEAYAEGIVPHFDARRIRVYDSYWNWNAQDIELLLDLFRHPRAEHAALMQQLTTSIINRACDRSLEQLNYVRSRLGLQAESAQAKGFSNAVQFLYDACLAARQRDPVFIDLTSNNAPLTTIDKHGNISVTAIPRRGDSEGARNVAAANATTAFPTPTTFPIRTFCDGVATFSKEHSLAYAEDLERAKLSGFTFRAKNVLLTGAGASSIGNDILRHLLSGGGRVTVTTSSYSPEAIKMYQSLYMRHGSKHSVLRVVPFNQGSHRDVQELVRTLDADSSWDLDFIIPFAALSENGRDIENLDSKSEIAHRVMLTNLLRLLGAVARSKRAKGIVTRPATVVLPLSPNHGLMGGDGLYAESKRSLEALLVKWTSESWQDYLSLIGVVIGWTRGTGLMSDNDVVAQAVESLGVRTFSADEVAAHIVTALGGRMNAECQSVPLVVDLGCGLGDVPGFKDRLGSLRRALHSRAEIQRAIRMEQERDAAVVTGRHLGRESGKLPSNSVQPQLSGRVNMRLPLPRLPDYDKDIKPLASSLQGMVDLSRVVVVTGFAELGPYGSSRTRWEMEKTGTLSLEGCVELAWMMGMIKHGSGVAKDGSPFSGWVDAKTLSPVTDAEIYTRYMSTILEHTGLRKIEPEMCDNGYDPERKEALHEVVIQRDLPPFEATRDVAETLKLQHGDKALITEDASGCRIQLKAGAAVMVPRASHFNRTVAGQIPTGWSPNRYGISDDIIEQVDPVTLFSLVCTVEAFLTSGIVDPYEWYQHIHVSEMGNCIGSSMGGLSSLRKMHRDRYIDRVVKGDILQETFINTTGAWINMLLTSSSGPIRTPVGACATALESLDTGSDLITAGKAKVCVVGGVEDFVEDVSFEFGSMKATCDTDAEAAAGRSPREMSRPTASSRSGFVEAQGCGVQVLTSAELALEMGLPIYGVVTFTSMSADKAGRSVPAPGKGVLTNARELPQIMSTSAIMGLPRLLSLDHRRRLLDQRREQIAQNVKDRLALLEEEMMLLGQSHSNTLSDADLDLHRTQSTAAIHAEARRQESEAAFTLGNQFWRSTKISPLRGALATWGLTIDDISVASLHGTSTVQNDLNEPHVVQAQLRHLGRAAGNLLPCVCQKWLTGHAKGAAGAWMVNGCLQMMDAGVVPGNRNADNIDERLRQHRHLMFPNATLPVGGGGINACSVTSFGFGQKGAQALLVHPRYLFATVSKEKFGEYAQKREGRWRRACRAFVEGMIHENMVGARVKKETPYPVGQEMDALLDPTARF